MSKHTYETTGLFHLPRNIIKDSFFFCYFYNTSVKSVVLGGGNGIIWANWLNKKSSKCTCNNDIPIKISDYAYLSSKRSTLCNCKLEAEEHFLLESSAACNDTTNRLKTYFTVNLAFFNYFDNWTDSIMPTINLEM